MESQPFSAQNFFSSKAVTWLQCNHFFPTPLHRCFKLVFNTRQSKVKKKKKVTSSCFPHEKLLLKHIIILIQIPSNQHVYKISVWYRLLLSKNAVGYTVLLTEQVTPKTLSQTHTSRREYINIKYVFAYTLEAKELCLIQ